MKPSKKEFIAEAEEIIEDVSNSILELQDQYNPETLNSIFRGIHTIKGLTGLFGFKGITDFSHTLEFLLDDLRLGRIEFTNDIIDFLLRNIDILKTLINQVAENKEVQDVSDAISEIETFRQEAKSKTKEPSLEDSGISPSIIKVLTQYEEHRLKSNLKEGKGIYLIKVIFGLENFAPQLEALNSNLKTIGEVIATLPKSEDVPEGSIGFNLLFGTSLTTDKIQSEISTGEVEQLVSPQITPKPVSTPAKQVEGIYKATTNTIRIDIDKLDRILDTIGELMLAKGAVTRIAHELSEAVGYIPLTIDVYKISQSLDRRLKELQSYVLELRMVPFSQIFTKLAQLVRRHIRETGKEINLRFFGEDTEIDKQIAEEIMDPLIHIIRNAIDHGIEPREKRLTLGKDEKGTVTLKAFPKGHNVVVMIQDDGAGLDKDKILRKAIEKGLISEDHDLEDNEIINLIFLPGLSTREDVSEISGRGVGMDIVKEKVTSLGGFVEIETKKDIGTTFTLTLPITLAIVKALIIEVANEHFAIPLTSITDTFIINPEKIQTIEGREVIELRNEMLPLLRVARAFMLDEKPRDEYFGVIVGVGERRLGLVVDALLGQTEIIIKPLGEYLKDIPGLSGAAEIGRHEVVLVLDIEAMLEEAFSRKKVVGEKV
jgi:two-component system chemotaxis sensor kinase CheA